MRMDAKEKRKGTYEKVCRRQSGRERIPKSRKGIEEGLPPLFHFLKR